ncbi:MAG: DnaJ domain-containing protein [Pseudomonadota bacterium]
MENYYEALNLQPSATMMEIKAAFRRLAKEYHPDSSRVHGGDVSRFLQINEAYHHLVSRLSGNREETASGPTAVRGQAWRFEGALEEGFDVIYILRVSRQAAQKGLRVALPWKKEDACPRCLGFGHTLAPVFGGPHLRKMVCPKCKGAGVIKEDSHFQLNLTPAIIEAGEIRLQGKGRYKPSQATRGDLVIKIKMSLESGARMWTA